METGVSDVQLPEVGELCEFGGQCAVQRMRIEVDCCDASRDSWEWKGYGDSKPVPYHSRGVPRVEIGSSSEGILQPPENFAIRDESGVRGWIGDDGAVSAWSGRLSEDVEQ